MSSQTYITHSPEQTERIGADVAAFLLETRQTDAFLALFGDLGAGKTAFVRGLCSILAPRAAVCSPTYAIVNEYKGEGGLMVYHFDMYRIESEDDLASIGFYDYEDAVFAVEWSENIPFALPERYFRIEIRKLPPEMGEYDSGSRKITIEQVTK